jgi:hypothetical protein
VIHGAADRGRIAARAGRDTGGQGLPVAVSESALVRQEVRAAIEACRVE